MVARSVERRDVAPVALSIIVPVLNEAAGIEDFLAHLKPLREAGCEVLLVDGGSRDDTVTRATDLCDGIVRSTPGRAIQMNAGAALANGEMLLFLHADTRLPADALDALSKARLAGRHRWGRFDVVLEGRHPMLPVIAFAMNLRSRLTGIATGDQAIFVLASEYRAIGGFPPQPLMEDIELSTRLRARSWPLCLRSRVRTSARRWLRYGVLRTIVLMWRLRLGYFLGVSPRKLHDAWSRS